MAGVEEIREELPDGLTPEHIPKHVAVILDGNRRWARERGLSVQSGYYAGSRIIKAIAYLASRCGIEVLPLFAYSTDNWQRPKEEVDFLMTLFEEVIQTCEDEFAGSNVRISVIGDKSRLHEPLQKLIASAEEITRANTGLHLLVAINYSGRYDIMQASRSIASKVKDGILQLEDINETLFDKELLTSCAKFPDPDLLIRTSGEQRISNFFLWQLDFTEVFFVKKNLREIEEEDFMEALASYQKSGRPIH